MFVVVVKETIAAEWDFERFWLDEACRFCFKNDPFVDYFECSALWNPCHVWLASKEIKIGGLRCQYKREIWEQKEKWKNLLGEPLPFESSQISYSDTKSNLKSNTTAVK